MTRPADTPIPIDDPRAAFEERLAARRADVVRLEARYRALGNVRLLLLLGVLAAVPLLFSPLAVFAPVALVPLAGILILSVPLDRAITARGDAGRAVDFYSAAISRLNGAWQGTGVWGDEFREKDHPYAADLDVFGRASVFEYLCAARTGIGRRTLAAWLLAPADPVTVRERQQAVDELAIRLELREALAVLGDDMPSLHRVDGIRTWAAATVAPWPRWLGPAAALMGVVNSASAILWLAGFGALWLFAGLAASSLMIAPFGGRMARSLRGGIQPARDMRRLAPLLGRLEIEEFATPGMLRLHEALNRKRRAASRRIARLERWLHLHDSLANILFAPIALVTLLPLQIALAMDRWRGEQASLVAGWLDAIGEIEALASLAGLRFGHPADAFPEIVEGSPRFEAVAMAHPLIPESDAVRNDLTLGEPRLLIVSGSNMSGKSTLLRATGVNVVLALAGAPVRAKAMRLSPLVIGASIRIQDSLEGHISRFYAEILRLRQIVELAHQAKAPSSGGRGANLFLLDEILHGTNSHDRRIGAEAVLRTLVDAGAIGMATTHDLALAAIADQPGRRAANVHFEDHLEDGRMVFDYRLRAGVVEHSNALDLMRSIGLKV